MDYELRPAVEADYNYCYRLTQQNMEALFTRHWGGWVASKFREAFRPRNISMVLVNGKRVGYLSVKAETYGYYIENIQLSSAVRGCGVGTRILANLLAKHHNKTFHLTTFDENPAKRLYERMGFRVIDQKGGTLRMERYPAQKFTLRLMTLRDYAAVVALWRGIPGIGLDEISDSRDGIARYLKRNPGLSFVACEQGAIVGAVLSGHDGRRGYLHHLAVAPSHREAGIAKALVARCLEGLAKQGIPKCNIFVYRSNVKGQSFWKHNGWNLRPDLCLMQQKTPMK